MKKKIFLYTLFMLFTKCSFAQNFIQEGNTFKQQKTERTNNNDSINIVTKYTYIDSNNIHYPIYLSSSGKAFIWKISKKTGKRYKYYLPKIGKVINPEGYK